MPVAPWMERDDLGCVRPSVDPRWWFFEDHFPPASRAYREAQANAKAICETCPVQELCLRYALTNGEPAGIWGGYTTDERKDLKRRYVK